MGDLNVCGEAGVLDIMCLQLFSDHLRSGICSLKSLLRHFCGFASGAFDLLCSVMVGRQRGICQAARCVVGRPLCEPLDLASQLLESEVSQVLFDYFACISAVTIRPHPGIRLLACVCEVRNTCTGTQIVVGRLRRCCCCKYIVIVASNDRDLGDLSDPDR